MRTKNNMCKVPMVPLLPRSLVRWYPGVEKYLHLQSLSSAKSTWYQGISSGGLKPSSPSWSWQGSDKILQICSTYVFYIFYTFYILYVFYIFYVRKLQPPTTCSPWFQCSTSAIVWCSDQIRSEKRDCSKLWSAKILHWPTSRPGTHLQSMASLTFLDCPSPLLFPHVLHPLQNLEKLLNIEQRNLSVLETFTTANKDTEALNPLLLWS